MPALSPTMTEGIVNKWLVKIGDTVKAGDIIAEIETDKATMEVEAVDEGKLEKIFVLARDHFCPGWKTHPSRLEDMSVLARRPFCPD